MTRDTKSQTPVHVGYIVDGNRRWAKERGLTSFEGHVAGYEALKEVLIETLAHGVQYASAYIFSTENWKRSEDEVGRLMGLLIKVLSGDLPLFMEKNVRLKVVGSRDRLSKPVIQAIDTAEAKTAHLTGGEFILCLNYGGHLEIVDAIKKCVQAGEDITTLTPSVLAEYMYAPEVPACDLIVRTSGERRLSNFMLWRSAYSELLFLDKHWPEMTKQDVTAILEEYSKRNRRFGG